MNLEGVRDSLHGVSVFWWYDVAVQFEGKIPVDGFTGKISRNVPLSKFLKVLELNDLKVRTEGRTVTVIF